MFAPIVLLWVTALATLLMLGVLGSLARSGISGIRECIYSAALILLSHIGFASQPWLPPILGIVVANFLMSSGMTVYYVGLRRFFGRPVPARWLCIGLAAQMIGIVIFWYVWRDLAARIVVVSVLHGTLAAAAAITIMRARPPHRPRYPYYFSAGIAWFCVAAHTLRGIVYLLRLDESHALTQETPVQVAFLAVGVMVVPALTLAMIVMVHDRMLANREREADTDSLTGTLSRKAWWMVADKALARAARSGRPMSLLMLDIDRFKQINDTHGHLLGDIVLQHFGAVARATLRTEDVIGRIGGEEFAVLFPDTAARSAAQAAQRLLETVRATPCASGKHTIRYSFSGGLAQWDGKETVLALTQRADRALYTAKHDGRDRVVACAGENALAPATAPC